MISRCFFERYLCECVLEPSMFASVTRDVQMPSRSMRSCIVSKASVSIDAVRRKRRHHVHPKGYSRPRLDLFRFLNQPCHSGVRNRSCKRPDGTVNPAGCGNVFSCFQCSIRILSLTYPHIPMMSINRCILYSTINIHQRPVLQPDRVLHATPPFIHFPSSEHPPSWYPSSHLPLRSSGSPYDQIRSCSIPIGFREFGRRT